jgi:hypothetical protein
MSELPPELPATPPPPPPPGGVGAESAPLPVPAIAPGDQASEDREHLSMLAIFHYVVGGLIALVACVPIIHLVIGLVLVSGALPTPDEADPVPQAMGMIFIVVAGLFITLGMAYAACVLIAGRKIQQRRAHGFCFGVACVLCLAFPFGTVLGVFTIVVLNRPSVKALFNGGEGYAAPDAASEFDRRLG